MLRIYVSQMREIPDVRVSHSDVVLDTNRDPSADGGRHSAAGVG
jgi:hypothetical protein